MSPLPTTNTEIQLQSPGERAEGLSPRTAGPRWIGFAGGLILAALLYTIMPDDVPHDARLTAAIAGLMAVWWMTEALPIPATALVPLVAFPILATGTEESPVTVDSVGASYGNNIIFLFMGGFMIALAMQRWNLHRRIALLVLSAMGERTAALITGFMAATGFLSMWVSNTATAVMMLPIGLSVLEPVSEAMERKGVIEKGSGAGRDQDEVRHRAHAEHRVRRVPRFAGDAHRHASELTARRIPQPGARHQYRIRRVDGRRHAALDRHPHVHVVAARESHVQAGGTDDPWWTRGHSGRDREARPRLDRREARPHDLHPRGRQLDRGPAHLRGAPISDAGIAITAGLLLFFLPAGAARGVRLLDWESAVKLPWGVLLLFGGGLALSGQFSSSGLTAWIGEISAGIAIGIGVDPMLLTIPVALAATCAFMLPVATPPNAVVYGTGYVSIGQMARAGLFLNLAGIVLISLTTMTLAVWVFGIVY